MLVLGCWALGVCGGAERFFCGLLVSGGLGLVLCGLKEEGRMN